MTYSTDIIKKAKEFIGYKESPANSNKTIFGKDYGMDGQPWCMMFIWDIFRMCDASPLFYDGKKVASCTALMDWAKKVGQWYDINPKPGDVVIYDFDDHKTKNKRHCGIVETVKSSSEIIAIEGNTSASGSQDNGGMVMEKTRKKSVILGYFRPKYDVYKPTPYTLSLPTITLKSGSKGYQVGLLQRFLNWYGGYGLSVDNSFGPKTMLAFKDFQKKENLTADGSCGPKSREKIRAVAKTGK